MRPTVACLHVAALRLTMVLLAGSIIPRVACADPNDYVFVPYGDAGSRYVQFAAGVAKTRDGARESAESLALGWSPTDRWFTAVYAGWYREPGEASRLSELSWVNHIKLIQEQRTISPEIGLYLGIDRPRDRSEGYEVTWGPTFQVDTPHMQLNANVWLQKNVGASFQESAVLTYQWQAKGLLLPGVEVGLQGFGNVGAWLHWSSAREQRHTLGPAIFVKAPLGNGEMLRIDAAVLAGLTSSTARGTLRLRAQIEF